MPVIEAQGLSKQFLLRHNASVELKVRFLSLLHRDRRQSVEEFWALRDVSLKIDRGEAVGLVGRNGSGKSTLLKLIAAIHRPTTGRLLIARNAQISSMIELGVGFHPELTGRENVFLNAAIHGLSRPAIEEIYRAIVEYSGLQHFIDVPIKNYSSGMHMRLGFAIAANMRPDILLLDEIFAVGDAEFQQRCMQTLRGFLGDGKTIIFVSHSPSAIRAICRRVCVLDQSRLVFDSDVESGLEFYEGHATAPPVEAPPSVPAAAPSVRAADPLASALAAWQLDFLQKEGLEPRDVVLEIGIAPDAPRPLASYMHEHRYHTLRDASPGNVIYLDAMTVEFDLVTAPWMFAALPLNSLAKWIASLVRKLSRSGRFYATWYENPDAANFDPIVHANGLKTYADRQPFHYPLVLIAAVCDAVGATVERVSVPTHPIGASVLRIARRS